MIILRQKSFSEKKEKNKVEKIGKGVALTGAGAAIAGGIGENIIADKTFKKAANKVGGVQLGKGGLSSIFVTGPNAQARADKGVEMVKRSLKNNKMFKVAGKADKIGTAVTALGTGAYLYGRHKNKEKKK